MEFLNEDDRANLESPTRCLAATVTSFTNGSSQQEHGRLGPSRLFGRTRRHTKGASGSIDYDLDDVLAFLEHLETIRGGHKLDNNMAIKRVKKPTPSELLFLSEMAQAA